MEKRIIYSYVIEYRYKKGKSFIIAEEDIVSVCETPSEMNNTPRLISMLKAKAFGNKSAAFKSGQANLWVTRIVSRKELSKSFYYTDKNYNK